MLKTELCTRIGIEYPIFSVGMGPVAGPALAAAVSERRSLWCPRHRVVAGEGGA